MKLLTVTLFSLLMFQPFLLGQSQDNDWSLLKEPYLSQKPPGMTPEIFASGLVSTEHQEHSKLAFSPNGKEIWWSRWRLPYDHKNHPQLILFMKFRNGYWQRPQIAPFSGNFMDGGPAFTNDGKKIIFYSRRPLDKNSTKQKDIDLWFVEQVPGGWSEPINMGNKVNSEFVDAAPTLAANNNLYFVSNRIQSEDPTGNNDIFISIYKGGEYLKAVPLDKQINTSYARDSFPFVAQDESYLIFCRDSRKFDKKGDLVQGKRKMMISFKSKNKLWGEAIDLGPIFNDKGARFVSLSPDNKYIFFTRYTKGNNEDYYWIDARVVEKLRPNELKRGGYSFEK